MKLRFWIKEKKEEQKVEKMSNTEQRAWEKRMTDRLAQAHGISKQKMEAALVAEFKSLR